MQSAVEAAEQYADGIVTPADLAVAQAKAEAVARPVGDRLGHIAPGKEEHRSVAMLWSAAWAAASAAHIRGQAIHVCMTTASPIDNSLHYAGKYREYEAKADLDEQLTQCQLFRDIFGDPFRPVSVDRRCLTRNRGFALRIAQRIYEEAEATHTVLVEKEL